MAVTGILIAFAAAVADAYALVLQAQEAHGQHEEQAGRFSLLWVLAHRRRWLLGTTLMALAWPIQIVALSFVPLTVVQVVLATFQVILVVIARVQLKIMIGRAEWLGSLAVTAGVALVILAAPHRDIAHPSAVRVAVPLAALAAGTLVAYGAGRRHPHGVMLAVGAGLGYAWVEFVDKLVSNAISANHAVVAILWLLTVAGFGVVAFVLENTALQRSPVVQVSPVIGSIQVLLPVLMALIAGIEDWTGGVMRLAELAAGLALAGFGAASLARSPANAAVS